MNMACSRQEEKASPQAPRAVILGMDGLDPGTMASLMGRGLLPNFSLLAGRGAFVPLQTANPPQSPVAWTSMATGNNPGRHGVFDFLSRDPKSYLPRLAITRSSSSRLGAPSFEKVFAGRPFWDILAEAGIPVTVLRWPLSFPPGAGKGKLISGMGVPDIKGGLGRYTLFTDRPDLAPGMDPNKVVALAQGKVLRSGIPGPLKSGLTGTKEVSEPFSLVPDMKTKTAALSVCGREYRLSEGQWSPWVPLRFSLGLGRSVSALCRFYLLSLSPWVSLYLSPVCVDPSDPCFPISRPGSYAPEIAAELGPFHTLGIPEDTKAVTENVLSPEAFLAQCAEILAEQEALLFRELSRLSSGVLANVFFTTDRIQHIFTAATEPDHPAHAELAAYGGVIGDWYARMDAILGRVLSRVDEQTLVMVCSDHGFAPFVTSVNLNTFLVEKGYMALTRRPGPADSEGGPLFEYVDWDRTRAYALGLSGVYLNLEGREGRGIVSAGQYRELAEKLAADLEGFRDPATGQSPIARAYLRGNVYSGPETEKAPDILAGFARGYRMSWQSALGGCPAQVLAPNTEKWTGDHCMDPAAVPGVCFASRKLARAEARITDIAPTLCAFFGLRPEMDGTSLL